MLLRNPAITWHTTNPPSLSRCRSGQCGVMESLGDCPAGSEGASNSFETYLALVGKRLEEREDNKGHEREGSGGTYRIEERLG